MDFYIPEIPAQATFAWALTAVVVGWWRGGSDGRTVAAIVLVQTLNGWLFSIHVLYGFATDTITLAICLALVLRGRNYWTIWAAASPVLSLATDVVQVAMGYKSWGYYSAQLTWFYVLAGALLIGSLLSPRHHAARGP